MFFDILRDISRPHWVDILLTLKKSEQGMAVRAIADQIGMSYMGVKQHCVAMEKLGYLDTWRHPQKTGRPLKLYRLTEKCEPLFPDIGHDLSFALLESLRENLGPNAPEKYLHAFFANRAKAYLPKVVHGETLAERAETFAGLRDLEGYASRCETSEEDGLRIVEHHSLIAELERTYPSVGRMEEQMVAKVLGHQVTRRVEKRSGQEVRIFVVEKM